MGHIHGPCVAFHRTRLLVLLLAEGVRLPASQVETLVLDFASRRHVRPHDACVWPMASRTRPDPTATEGARDLHYKLVINPQLHIARIRQQFTIISEKRSFNQNIANGT